MKRLYLFDLDGTTGDFETGPLLFRPGFIETARAINAMPNDEVQAAITTRALLEHAEDVIYTLARNGLILGWNVYVRQDVSYTEKYLFPYKDYDQAYADHGITDPAAQTIVLGDFHGFEFRKKEDSKYGFTPEEYLNWDFKQNSHVLSSNYSLNDHPYPGDMNDTPVYVAFPQPWTTFDENGQRISLDMHYVFQILEKMFAEGNGNFAAGFDKFKSNGIPNQYVEDDGLVKNIYDLPGTFQRYAVMKGERKHWNPMVRLE